jgi:hypothetical protein
VFDDLYGAGAESEWLARFHQAATDVGLAATVEFADVPDGTRVYATFTKDAKPAGSLKADHYQERVFWLSHHILIPGLNHHAALVKHLGPWYVQKGAGLQVLKPRPGEEVAPAFLKTGFELQPDGTVTLDLAAR